WRPASWPCPPAVRPRRAEMELMADQNTAPWLWKPGQSGNPGGRPSRAEREARRDAKMSELAQAFGGLENLNPLERERIKLASEMLLARPRNNDDRVRSTNLADRLLRWCEASVRRRCGRARGGVTGPSFADALASRSPKS